jgi:class 3 adenylate cyclase
VVNTAARLQAFAQPGQIVASDAVFEHVRDRYGQAEPMRLTVRGKADEIHAHLLGGRRDGPDDGPRPLARAR